MKFKAREITQKELILKSFSHLETDRSKVLLWQTSKTDRAKKTLIYCELTALNETYISLTPINEDIKKIIKKSINTQNKIFIRGTYNGVLFKCDDFKINGEFIELAIPDRILLSENRKSDRFQLHERCQSFLKISNLNSNLGHTKKSFKINDFGIKGLSITINKKESHYFEIGRTYNISNILGISFDQPLRAVLVHQKVHSYIHNQQTKILFKAGFKLEDNIPVEIFKKLMEAHLDYDEVAS